MGTGSMEQSLLLHTTAGHGFVAQLKDMVTRMKAGKEFMKPADGAKVLPPAPNSGVFDLPMTMPPLRSMRSTSGCDFSGTWLAKIGEP